MTSAVAAFLLIQIWPASFIKIMKRFLPTDVFDRTLAQDKFQVYLQNTLAKLFKTVSNELLGKVTNNEFRM